MSATRQARSSAFHFAHLAFLAAGITLISSHAEAVTITFTTRPDGTPIENVFGCGEITFETFRPWGVLFTPPEGDVLNIRTTLDGCLSGPNGLAPCSANGVLNITFVLPGTNTTTVVSGIELGVFTQSQLTWQGIIRVYNGQNELLDTWQLSHAGFCREPPFYYNFYHFSAPGQIARVECTMLRVGIDDVVVTEATTPVDGSTWGLIKSMFQ